MTRVCPRCGGNHRADEHEEAKPQQQWTLTICSHCGAEAGMSAHGHYDAPGWKWKHVKVVLDKSDEARLAAIRSYVPFMDSQSDREVLQALLDADIDA